MIVDEKKSAWLKEFLHLSVLTEQEEANAKDIHETFRKLWKVVRAAEELCKRADLLCGYKRLPGDPPAIIQLKDIELALADLEEPSNHVKIDKWK